VLKERKATNPINPPARDDCLLATHPSDHNSIYIERVSHAQRQKRETKRQKRRARDLQRVSQGKLDERTYRRGDAHDVAFLVPVPLYYYPVVGFGGFPGACAAVRSLFFFPINGPVYFCLTDC
jgi:hypothetical protein